MNVESDWFRNPEAVLTAMRGDDAPPAPSIPGYQAIVELHRGNQAVVMLGRQRETGERVAIKVLLSGAWVSDSAKRRFEREIELVSSLDHPNIVRVLNRGLSADGHPFLVMEYVDGVPLDEYVAPQRDDGAENLIDRKNGLSLFVTICDAVGYAHQRGIIHRDLKPSNIRIDTAGQPRILDFGLARLVDEPISTAAKSLTITLTSQFLGTPAYAAPEQFLGRPHQIDTRADIYALGVILYQVITGRLPYRDSDTIGGLIRGITEGEIVRPDLACAQRTTRGRRRVSADLQAVALKALAREPADRYQTVNALTDDLRAVLSGRPTSARPPSRREELVRAIRQNRVVAGLIGAIVVVCVGFAVTAGTMQMRAVRQAERVERARVEAVAAHEQARADARRSQAVLDFLTGMIFDTHVPSDEAEHAASQLILDRAHERVNAHPPDDPQVRAELHNILGRSYYSIGAIDRSIEHFHATLEGDGLKDRPARRLHIQLLLSLILLERQQVAPAEDMVHQSLDELAAFRRGPNEAISVNQYAACTMRLVGYKLHHDVGNLDLAEMVLREAWASVPADSDPHQVHVAIATDLADVLIAQGKCLDEAVAILKTAIEMSTRIDGPNHSQTLKARATLVSARQQQSSGVADPAAGAND